MTSIDRNQPEKNHQDLTGQAALEKLNQIVADAPNCFFCSSPAKAGSLSSRPMNVREVDDRGRLWFLTADDTSLAQELAREPAVTLFFQGAKTSEFMQLDGQATLSHDQVRIDQLWEPILKTWFTEGSKDRRIRVIQVVPHQGYYWDQKHGGLVASTKMALGALLGVTLDDSIQGACLVLINRRSTKPTALSVH